jgi:DNA-binding NtrC family response regulator
MSSAVIRLALCSRDLKLRPLLAPALGHDFRVVPESDCDKLKQMVRAGDLDVLLLDLDPEACNIEEQVRFFDDLGTGDVAVVVLTDDAARPTAIDLVQRGAYSYSRKPLALRELKTILRRAHEHAAMKRELEGRKGAGLARPESTESLRCDGLIGSSAEMRSMYDMIHRVAGLNASVLVTGESGTGKELIARAIHNLGDRASAPFIAVYCGAIPETLMESELFGHEKGAFTGTTGTRIGYLEQAGNGTLLIDEIGELSLQTQVKLLRVLQQREFTRLGSGRTIPLKARVVFATHRDLPQMVADGTFRLDLFYRINVVSIKTPALADHPEDIPALCEHFLRQYSDLYQKRVVGFAPEALALLKEYDWPGNVRELENVIQSSIVCADTENIVPQDLPERFQEPALLDECDLPQVGSFERMLRDFKFRVASKAIDDCKGNKTLAARSLQISRSYLHRLVRLHEEPERIDAA